MFTRRDRLASSFISVALLAAVAVPALAETAPPRYLVQILGSFEGGNTKAYALNDFGETTGESGTGSITIGYHAFWGTSDGTIEDIESYATDISEGTLINNAGQIAGTTTVFPWGGGAGTSTPFRYTPGVGMEPLDSLDGTFRNVVDMNESGDVVGRYHSEAAYRAYIYTDEGGMQDLGSLGSASTYVHDINDEGQVVGVSWNEDNWRRAYLWEDGVMQDLGTLGGDSSRAYYVNSAGVVVGEARTEDGTWHAFRYSADRGMEPLPAMEGMKSCAATWVTDTGMITGWWQDEDFRQRAFYYTDDEGIVDIGLDIGDTMWTGPVAANDAGQILLWKLEEAIYDVSAMIYVPGSGAHLLNDLLTIDLGWELDTPSDINDAGQIVAYGFAPTQEGPSRYTSVLLTPVSRGDLNCDGAVDFNDIDAFVQALGDADGYAADRPRCERMLADSNCDGSVNFDDIDAFVACLSGDCGCD